MLFERAQDTALLQLHVEALESGVDRLIRLYVYKYQRFLMPPEPEEYDMIRRKMQLSGCIAYRTVRGRLKSAGRKENVLAKNPVYAALICSQA